MKLLNEESCQLNLYLKTNIPNLIVDKNTTATLRNGGQCVLYYYFGFLEVSG